MILAKFTSTAISLYFLVIFASLFSFTHASSIRSKSRKLQKLQKSQVDPTSYEDEDQNQYENEEYTQRLFRTERENPYQVVYMKQTGASKESESVVLKEQQLHLSESKKALAKERLRAAKMKSVEKRSVFFNKGVESVSDISSVPDEAPRVRPFLTEFNAMYSDFTSGRRVRLVHHLPTRMGDFDIPKAIDYSDVLVKNVRSANLYTSHHQEIDGYMTVSRKEENIHLRRNPSIHPQVIYNRNNEVDPLVAIYREDVDTSQREFSSHFGRAVGRDNKGKIMENRNTFSSINDGCPIS